MIRPSKTPRVFAKLEMIGLPPRTGHRRGLQRHHFLRIFTPGTVARLRRALWNLQQRRRDRSTTTYCLGCSESLPGLRQPLTFQSLEFDVEYLLTATVQAKIKSYLDHTFDLLGSGPVRIQYGMDAPGHLGTKHAAALRPAFDERGAWLADHVPKNDFPESSRIWRVLTRVAEPGDALVPPLQYVPIDWHIDYRTGFRWNPTTWFKNVPLSSGQGCDIKSPWELARLQHLPQMALVYMAAQRVMLGQDRRPTMNFVPRLPEEFRDQVLDFVATNPPRTGIHWTSTMEVSIRIANILVAYDIFTSAGATFDSPFQEVLARSVYEHGQHIVNHLEWRSEARGNHYLANVAGLLFVATYLECTEETDLWLALATQELFREIKQQFLPDGSNFEGSTCYHRLSAEIVTYGSALLLGLPRDKLDALSHVFAGLPQNGGHRVGSHPTGVKDRWPALATPLDLFPQGFGRKLHGMARFTAAVTKPNRLVAQIGDNDSGRFFKIFPVPAADDREDGARHEPAASWQDLAENSLWHEPLIHAIHSLLDFPHQKNATNLDARALVMLARGRCLPLNVVDAPRVQRIDGLAQEEHRPSWANIESPPFTHTTILEFPEVNLRAGMHVASFPDFGLYIFRSRQAFLSVRCGPVGQHGKGGHAHNDQLSVELNVGGVDYIADPGTLTYTGQPRLRNLYRSAAAHFCPRPVGCGEPSELSELFRLADRTMSRCHLFGAWIFVGSHFGYGQPLIRKVEVMEHRVIITDGSYGRPILPPDLQNNRFSGCVPFSPGYGIVEREPTIGMLGIGC